MNRPTAVVLGAFLRSEYYDLWQRQQELVTLLQRSANVLYVERAAAGAITPARVLGRLRKLVKGRTTRANRQTESFPEPPEFLTWLQEPSASDAARQRSAERLMRAIATRLRELSWDAPALWVCNNPSEIWKLVLSGQSAPVWYDMALRVRTDPIFSALAPGVAEWFVTDPAIVTTDTETSRLDWSALRDDVLIIQHGAREWGLPGLAEAPRHMTYYVGSLNWAVDSDYLSGVASFALGGVGAIGPAAEWPTGVHGLGWVAAGELSARMSDGIAGLVPYRVEEDTAGVYPTKVYEYLLAGMPTISSPLPALAGLEGVLFARNVDEASDAWNQARQLTPAARSRLIDVARENGWSKRFAPIIERLDLGRPPK